jgi:hypothetical protein
MKRITVEATSIEVTPGLTGSVDVQCEDVDEVLLLAQIDADDAVGHYGTELLLDTIGRDAAIEYWNIKELEEM